MKKLGLSESTDSFDSHLLVTALTDKALQIEYSAGVGSSIQDGVSIRQVSSVRCP